MDRCVLLSSMCVIVGRMPGDVSSLEIIQATGSHWRPFSTQHAQSAAVRVRQQCDRNHISYPKITKHRVCICFLQLLYWEICAGILKNLYSFQDTLQRTVSLHRACSTPFCLKTTMKSQSSKPLQLHHSRTQTKRRRKRR